MHSVNHPLKWLLIKKCYGHIKYRFKWLLVNAKWLSLNGENKESLFENSLDFNKLNLK